MTRPAKCPHCYGTGQRPNWKRCGAELRKRRVKAGVSLREAAREAKMSPTHLSDMERGIRSLGGPKAVRALARFGLSVEHAFTFPVETWNP